MVLISLIIKIPPPILYAYQHMGSICNQNKTYQIEHLPALTEYTGCPIQSVIEKLIYCSAFEVKYGENDPFDEFGWLEQNMNFSITLFKGHPYTSIIYPLEILLSYHEIL